MSVVSVSIVQFYLGQSRSGCGPFGARRAAVKEQLYDYSLQKFKHYKLFNLVLLVMKMNSVTLIKKSHTKDTKLCSSFRNPKHLESKLNLKIWFKRFYLLLSRSSLSSLPPSSSCSSSSSSVSTPSSSVSSSSSSSLLSTPEPI